MKIILGSQSIGRKEVLEKAGYTFEIRVADIDEKAIRSDNHEELPLLIARAKADKLLTIIHEPAILITSEQVVVYNKELREKPESEHQAGEYLRSYGIDPVQTNTAVVVVNTATGKRVEGVDIARVYFKPIPQAVIDELIKERKVMHAAGGFIIEHPLLKPYVERIEGDPDSVTGLPLKLVEELMEKVKDNS